VALIALLAMPTAPVIASSPPLPSVLFAYDSNDSYIGRPAQVMETGPATSVTFAGYPAGDPRISAIIYTPTDNWTVNLEPPDGQQLTVGTYVGADGAGPGDPLLRVTRASSGCAPSHKNSFVIHELTRNATGMPTSLALSFQHWCTDDSGPMVGRLRAQSTTPLASLSVPHTSRNFGAIATGRTVTQTFTVGANGDGPVKITSIGISGAQATDFVLNDPCSGATLQQGAACSFDITFAPPSTGDRKAVLTITHDAPVSPQVLPLIGAGLIPTTAALRVEPDTTWFSPGLLITGTVTPNPAGGTTDLWIDGVFQQGGLNAQGSIPVARPRTLGAHTATMHYLGTDTHADSWSPELAFTVSNTTATTLTPGSTSVASGTAVTFTGTVSTASNLLYSGGTMTIRDLTTGTNLASAPVDRNQPSVSVTTTLANGSHDIRARYSGVSGILNSSSSTHTITVGSGPTPTPTATPTPTPTATPTPTPTPTPGPDTVPPTGVVAFNAAFTNLPAVVLSTAGSDSGSGVTHVALSNDGTTWTTRPYAATQAWTLPSIDGTRTVYAKWRDAAGNWSAVASDTIVLDTVAPTVTAPGHALLAGTALSVGRVTVRVPWTGSDPTSGVAQYEVAQQTDGGVPTIISTTLTAPTFDRLLPTQHTFAFQVRGVDRAGNVGGWVTGSSFGLSAHSESSAAIRYVGTWTSTHSSVYWGGAAKRSSAAGARALITFTGRSIAWVARKGPSYGKAAIYVNGVKVATVDLYATSYQSQRVVWAANWSTAASRTITIRVSGTTGRPRVDLDALVTGS
jgi:hypothetical protein